MTGADGDLRIWENRTSGVRARLCASCSNSPSRVIVAHGEAVHDRAAYERALELPAWSDD
jgi:hypothetical protein